MSNQKNIQIPEVIIFFLKKMITVVAILRVGLGELLISFCVSSTIRIF